MTHEIEYRNETLTLTDKEWSWLKGIKEQYVAGEITKAECVNQGRVLLDARRDLH